MSKTKTRKRGGTRGNSITRTVPTTSNTRNMTESTVTKTAAVVSTPRRNNTSRRSVSKPGARTADSLIMPIMVALGCWGMAISFAFFFPDPNHYAYSALCAMMGITWTIIVGVRIARMRNAVR